MDDFDIYFSGGNAINRPNGKSCQKYHFLNRHQAKHAVGVNHKKIAEWTARDGIGNIVNQTMRVMRGEEKIDHGYFIIEGKAKAVDQLMLDIRMWLINCDT